MKRPVGVARTMQVHREGGAEKAKVGKRPRYAIDPKLNYSIFLT